MRRLPRLHEGHKLVEPVAFRRGGFARIRRSISVRAEEWLSLFPLLLRLIPVLARLVRIPTWGSSGEAISKGARENKKDG